MIRKLVTSVGVVALLASLVVTTGCAKKEQPKEDEAAEAAAGSAATGSTDSESMDMGEEDDIPLGNTSSVDSQGRVRKDVMEQSSGKAGGDSIVSAALFAFDSSTLDAAARAILDEVAAKLAKNSSWVVTLEGHCDNRGTEEYNLGLGQRRADAAKRYLLQKGISSSRLDTVSFGEAYPVDPANNEAAWAKNRRVHFAFSKGAGS